MGKKLGTEAHWMTWQEILPYKEQLIDLEFELLQNHYPGEVMPRSYTENKVALLETYLASGNTFFWGVVDGDLLAGYYWAYIMQFIDHKRWVLSSLMIRDGYRGSGLGREAIGQGLMKAKELGCSEASTMYVPVNKRAEELYKKAGYEITRIEAVKKL